MMMRQRTTKTPVAVRVASILCIGLIQLGFNPLALADGPPPIAWESFFDGDGWASGSAVQQTTDGGYIAVGSTFSVPFADSDTRSDIYLVKTDARGDFVWGKVLGGAADETGTSVQQTFNDEGDADGYVIAGYITTWVGNDRTMDAYLVKIDAEGEIVWERIFNRADYDIFTSVQQTRDGGFIAVGTTGGVQRPGVFNPEGDVYLVKTDSEGNVTLGDETWERTFRSSGNTLNHRAASVQETFNAEGDADGYIVAGTRGTHGRGPSNFYLLKTDTRGEKDWDKILGGAGRDFGSSVQQTFNDEGDPDGYIVAGLTNSFGFAAAYLVKTDKQGNKSWQNHYRGARFARAGAVRQTRDGGYVIAGYTSSGDGGNGTRDFYLVKTDKDGREDWWTTAGGDDDDLAFSVDETLDGGYIVAGWTLSFAGEGEPCFSGKCADLYLVKFAGPVFRRGDSNDDGGVDLSDVIFTLSWLFLGGPEPGCLAVANTNGDEGVDLSDPVSLLGHLFLGGPAPAEPFLECGPGTLEADAAIGCEEAPASCTSSL